MNSCVSIELNVRQSLAAPYELPSANMVHVHCLPFSDRQTVTSYVSAWLSMDELKRASRLLFASDHERFVLSHAYTRAVLAGYLGIHPTDLSVTTNEYGKPMIAAESHGRGKELGFNLAHCGTHAFVAVARTMTV